MTYQIRNTANDVVATIDDGASNNNLSLLLVGQKYAGYGAILQENLVKLLENFSFDIPPQNPINGQIWHDRVHNLLSYYDSSAWHTIANITHLSSNISSLRSEFNDSINSNVGTINNNIASTNANVTAANAAISSLTILKAPLASPALTGVPTAPTADHLTSTTQVATTEFVRNELGYYSDSDQLAANVTALIDRFNTNIASNVDSINSRIAITNANVAAANVAIATLNTGLTTNVNSINASLTSINANVRAANTAISSLNTLKAPLASPALTGVPTAPTADIATSTTQLATTAFVHTLLPAGIIMQWYGSTSSVPYGWALCNGQTVNGYTTPNLSNKFVVAQGTSYAPGSSGGAASVTPTASTVAAHDHGGTQSTTLTSSQIPTHNHSVSVTGAVANHSHTFTDVYAIVGDYELGGSTASTRDRNGNYIYPSFYASNASDGDYDNGAYGFPSRTDATSPAISMTVSESTVGSSLGHSHAIVPAGEHTHTISTVNTIPPYYSLCWIMKVV